jgi:pimeloyl-ACP methyl ester carboxylesterase
MTPRAILLPGSVLPAELAYSSLITALGSDAEVVAKDLEVYATEEAPSGYDLDLEVAGVLREAAAHGWEQFHLVGYSGGGAAALAAALLAPMQCAACRKIAVSFRGASTCSASPTSPTSAASA